MLNSKNDFNTFIDTKSIKSWSKKCKSRSFSRSEAFSQGTSQIFDSIKVKQIRLEHFQNFKKLRRRMDRAYLRIRHIQAKGGGKNAKEDESGDGETSKIIDPVYEDSVKTYRQISQNFSSLHSQQVYFGGFYGHNDPISPMTANVESHRASSMLKIHIFNNIMDQTQ